MAKVTLINFDLDTAISTVKKYNVVETINKTYFVMIKAAQKVQFERNLKKRVTYSLLGELVIGMAFR